MVSQVSDVLSWSGITSLEMNKALEIRVPHNMPHVSRFARVFCDAMARNRCRKSGGRKIVRKGVPFSRYAEGLKVNSEGLRSDDGGIALAWPPFENGNACFSGRSGGVSLNENVSICFGGGSGGCCAA